MGDVICGRPLNVIAYGSKWSRTVWWLAISHYHQHDCIWSVKRGTYYKYTIDRKWSSISILYYNTFFSALNQCVLKSANSEMLYKILSINPSFLIHFCTIFGIFGAMWAQRDIYHSGVYGTFLCVQKGSLCRRGSRNAERPFNLEKFISIEACYIILYILWSI